MRKTLLPATLLSLLLSTNALFAVTQIAYVEVGSNPVSIAIDPTRNLAYAANNVDQTIAVIDTNAHTLLATIPCNPPAGVAVNPITNLIYVNSSGVQVIDGGTRSIIANIATGAGAGGIAVDPTLNKIFSVNSAGDSLAIIDGTTNTLVSKLPVGNDPVGVAVDITAHLVFVSNLLSGTVSVVDGQSNAMITTITLPGAGVAFANGMAVDHALHRLYVTDNNNYTLDVIDTRTFTVSATATGFSSPHDVSVNLQTHGIFVLDFGLLQTIHAVNPSTLQITSSIERPLPIASAVDPNTGDLYVCARTRVLIFRP